MTVKKKYNYHSNHMTGPCRFCGRQGVFCDEGSVCSKCGWNYDVEEERKKANKVKFAVNSSFLLGRGSFSNL